MAVRDINRNVRGQVVSYPITEEGLLYGNVYFVDKDDGTQSKVARYLNIDVVNFKPFRGKSISVFYNGDIYANPRYNNYGWKHSMATILR